MLDAAFAAQPMSYWAKRFDQCDVWWAPVQKPADLMDDPQAHAAGAWIRAVAGNEPVPSVDAPIRFDGRNRRDVRVVPALGEHTAEVLGGRHPDPAETEAVS